MIFLFFIGAIAWTTDYVLIYGVPKVKEVQPIILNYTPINLIDIMIVIVLVLIALYITK